MPEPPEGTLLFDCYAEIELALNQGGDVTIVHRLAAQHPELSEDLYDFFACVIEGQYDLDRPRPDLADMDLRVLEMLRRRGSDTPSAPKTFLALVSSAAGRFINDVAAGMEVTPDFLVDASDNGRVLPLAARRELVRRARLLCDIDEREGIASFDVSSAHRRAASRDTAYAPNTATYDDVVRRSSLSADEKRFWLGLP